MSLGQPLIDISTRPPPSGCLTLREKQVATFVCAAQSQVPQVLGLGQTPEQIIRLELAARYPGYDACEIAQMPVCETTAEQPESPADRGGEEEEAVSVEPPQRPSSSPQCKTDSMQRLIEFCDENPTAHPSFPVTLPDGTTRVADSYLTCDHPEAQSDIAQVRELPFCEGHGKQGRRAAYAVGGVVLLLLLGGGGYAVYRATRNR